MTDRVFRQYLALNRHYAVTQQLYKKRLISRADMTAVKKHIADIEMAMIMPKQKTAHHPRKLTDIK